MIDETTDIQSDNILGEQMGEFILWRYKNKSRSQSRSERSNEDANHLVNLDVYHNKIHENRI